VAIPKTKRPKRPKRAPKVPKGQPSKEVSERRRSIVERLWVDGWNYTDISEHIEKELNEKWSRQTIAKDVNIVRERWEREGRKTTSEGHKEELNRMCRRVYRAAMDRKTTAVRREIKDGKKVITTVLMPDPDLANANKAIERMAILRGLNVVTVDGQLGVHGLSDILADVADDLEMGEFDDG